MTSSPSSSGGRLAGRIALITGASRGIGAAVARRFAEEGAQLILVARTVGGLEEVDDAVKAASGQNAVLVPLDLAIAGDGIDRLGAAIYERFKRLDILVGNAASLGHLSPLGHIEPKDWDRVLATNLTANWRLIRSLDPLLRQSDAGRAVFVTSGVARRSVPYWGSYAVSKAALDSMVGIWAAELAGTAVQVNLLNPGPTATRIRAEAFPGEDAATLPSPDVHTEAFVHLCEPACKLHGEWIAGDEWAARNGATLQ